MVEVVVMVEVVQIVVIIVMEVVRHPSWFVVTRVVCELVSSTIIVTEIELLYYLSR